MKRDDIIINLVFGLYIDIVKLTMLIYLYTYNHIEHDQRQIYACMLS